VSERYGGQQSRENPIQGIRDYYDSRKEMRGAYIKRAKKEQITMQVVQLILCAEDKGEQGGRGFSSGNERVWKED
jgi:hypothetical protein